MAVQDRTEVSEAEASFVRRARRAQLVDVAITLLAEVGAVGASTVAVARRAGVSRGVLTYHFRDKDDLLDAVVERVYAVARDHLSSRVDAAADPAAALRTFVAGSLEFYVAYPDHLAALSEVFGAGRHRAGGSREGRTDHRRETDEVAALLRAGQDTGRFRAFDVPLMAASIRALLDVGLTRVRAGDDPARLREELTASVAALTAGASS